MYGMPSWRATAEMAAAIFSACSSLSMTQGPAIRNSSGPPIVTLCTWKDMRKRLYGIDGDH